MNYWLMKFEPSVFSIDDLKSMPERTEHWDGVRNYQVRNVMRDQMKVGDLLYPRRLDSEVLRFLHRWGYAC